MKNDDLGERMKKNYEDRTRYSLPRRTYTVIRADGKAFHTFTKGFKRPFDNDLMAIMDHTAIAMCRGIQGAVLAYVQSDEISIVLTDFATPNTESWFDGNVQKMASISASIATAAFNQLYMGHVYKNMSSGTKILEDWALGNVLPAHFDSRVFTIPDRTEVENYLIWRQQDAVRNSIQMAAQSVYSQKELHGHSCNELQEMLFQKGINWNDYASGEKRGRAIVKTQYEVSATAYFNKDGTDGGTMAVRNKWVALTGMGSTPETPAFASDKEFLRSKILLSGVSND